jgi:hypothetical protein
MAVLAADRNTDRRSAQELAPPIAAATKIYGGGLVSANAAGFAKPASNTAGELVIGVSDEQKDNSGGANGDLLIQLRRGQAYLFNNSVGSPVTQAKMNQNVFVEDDNTVALAASNNVVAGKFIGFGGDPTGSDNTQCWVLIT